MIRVVQGGLTGSDVAGDDLQVGELLTDCLQDSQHTLRMTMGGVEDQSIGLDAHQHLHLLDALGVDAHGGGH